MLDIFLLALLNIRMEAYIEKCIIALRFFSYLKRVRFAQNFVEFHRKNYLFI